MRHFPGSLMGGKNSNKRGLGVGMWEDHWPTPPTYTTGLEVD